MIDSRHTKCAVPGLGWAVMAETSVNPYDSAARAARGPEQELLPPRPDSSGQNAVIWTLWLTYGAFYFCRTNISAAVPGLKGSIESGGLGLSAAEVGWILAS